MKTQPARIGRPRNCRKRGGFFCQCHGLGPLRCHHLIHALQEGNSFQVFAPSVHIGNPFTGFAAVIAIQHGGHGIYPQPIHAKPLQPVQGIADQEVTHLGAAQVVNERIPVVVKPFTRVGVFVKMTAVKLGQAMRIGGEVGGHPIQKQAQTCCMATRHKPGKTMGISKARSGCVQADGLVTPRTIKRVFADGQQLQMRKTHVLSIRDERFGQFVPREPAARARVGAIRHAPP